METFEKCVKTLKASQSDNEKLAALMVVSKISPDLPLTKENVCTLYEAVSSKFLIRLIKSKPSNIDTGEMFQDVALSIISQFVRIIPAIVLKEQLLFQEVLSAMESSHDEGLAKWLEILLLISYHESGLHILLSRTCIDVLKKSLLIANLQQNAFTIFKNFLQHLKSDEAVLDFINEISEEFRINQELVKFQYVSILTELFALISNKGMSWCIGDSNIEILKNISSGCGDIMQSRVKGDIKRSVITLLSNVMTLFSSEWIFNNKCIENNSKFILLTLTVINIELSCLFQVSAKENFLISHKDFFEAIFNVSKNILQFLCSDVFETHKLSSDAKFIVGAFNCLKNIMRTTYDFFKEVKVAAVVSLDNSVLLAALSMVCVWATEETEHLREELKETVPVIVKMGVLDFEENVMSKTTSKFLFIMSPCVAQLLPDDSMRKVLVSSKCHHLYVRYYLRLIEDKSFEAINSVTHIIYQFLILESKMCVNEARFDDLIIAMKQNIQEIMFKSNVVGDDYASIETIALFFTLLRLKCDKVDAALVVTMKDSLDFLFSQIDKSIEQDLKDIWIVAAQNIVTYARMNAELHNLLRIYSQKLSRKSGRQLEDYKSVFMEYS